LLDDYVDQALSPSVRQDLERHLAECSTCEQEVAQLRELLARAAALPSSREPQHDLWPRIKAAIAKEASAPAAERAGGRLRSTASKAGLTKLGHWLSAKRSGPASSRDRLRLDAGPRWPGVFRPIYVLATVLLAALIVSTFSRHPGRMPAPESSRDMRSTSVRLGALVQATLQALEAETRWNDPEFLAALPRSNQDSAFYPLCELLAQNRQVIDQAISQLRDAWQANPESPGLAQLLASAYLARADLQRQQARLVKLM
jgi:hypothetical protein